MSRRALLIALFVSLAVNIFAVGALVGAAVIGPRGHRGPDFAQGGPPRGRGPGGGAFAGSAALAPEHREAWRTALREQQAAAGPKLREARQAREQAWRALGREPVDAQAVLGALQRSRALEGEARADIDRRIVEFAGALPADERGRLAAVLAEPRRGGGGPSGRRGPPGERQAGLPDR